jgi:hypothetical protein
MLARPTMTGNDSTRPHGQALRVAGAQLENVVGDIEGNTRRIREAMEWAEGEGPTCSCSPSWR